MIKEKDFDDLMEAFLNSVGFLKMASEAIDYTMLHTNDFSKLMYVQLQIKPLVDKKFARSMDIINKACQNND